MALPRYLGMALRIGGRLSESATERAREELAKTEVGHLLHSLEKLSHRSTGKGRRLASTLDRMRKRGVGQEVAKFAARQAGKAQDVGLDELIRALGPAGHLLKKMLRGQRGGLERDIHTAATFLQSLGYDVKPAIRPHNTPVLEPTGFDRPRPGRAKPFSPSDKRVKENRSPLDQRIVPSELGEAENSGQQRRVQMVKVNGSTNVYAVGYDESKWDMYVTFLGGKGKTRSGEGTTYCYHGVPPDLFNNAVGHLSSQMGEWVWDNLRTRGSLFSHQFTYEMVRVGPGGYVPRHATAIGYRPRLVRQSGKLYGSPLRGTGWFRGTRAGQVARGTPNRGTPNRGTPSRGR